MTDKSTTLLNFPCDFNLKIFGLASEELEITVYAIIRQHCLNLSENAIQTRHSANNKYLALTVTVMAQSQQQLDNIYHDLSKNPHVIMVV
jgi:putative lipoic acid-binding regulatory protein